MKPVFCWWLSPCATAGVCFAAFCERSLTVRGCGLDGDWGLCSKIERLLFCGFLLSRSGWERGSVDLVPSMGLHGVSPSLDGDRALALQWSHCSLLPSPRAAKSTVAMQEEYRCMSQRLGDGSVVSCRVVCDAPIALFQTTQLSRDFQRARTSSRGVVAVVRRTARIVPLILPNPCALSSHFLSPHPHSHLSHSNNPSQSQSPSPSQDT